MDGQETESVMRDPFSAKAGCMGSPSISHSHYWTKSNLPVSFPRNDQRLCENKTPVESVGWQIDEGDWAEREG
jgi:hypothetical protein